MKKININFPPNFSDIGLLVIRIGFGLAMIYGHGWGKLSRFFGSDEIKFADPFGLGPEISLGLAMFAEVFCATFFILGLYTRVVVIPLLITMVTAFFVSHLSDPFGQQEKVILFATVFIAIFFTGPGKYSIDNKLQSN